MPTEMAGDCCAVHSGGDPVNCSPWSRTTAFFSDASLVWVNAIVWAIAAAWVALLGVLLYVGFDADDPGLPLSLFLMVIGVTVLGLLMVVMRALLRQATTLRIETEAVI